jgi:hypothetical protein
LRGKYRNQGTPDTQQNATQSIHQTSPMIFIYRRLICP